jgi:hypothetical protein
VVFLDKARTRPTPESKLRHQVKKDGYSSELADLPIDCLRLLMKRGFLWEYEFLERALDHELRQSKSLRLDLRFGRATSQIRTLSRAEFEKWTVSKISALEALFEKFEKYINEAIPEALAPPGVPGDPYLIFHCTRRLGELYRTAIEWSLNFSEITAEQPAEQLLDLLREWSQGLLEAIEELPDRVWYEVEKIKSLPPEARAGREMVIKIALKYPKAAAVSAEIDNLKRAWGGNAHPT